MSCEQFTGTIDRNSAENKPTYMRWVKSGTKKHAGHTYTVPRGKECYVCFYIRRKFFENMPLEKLIEARRDESTDAEFWEKRADHVSGGGKFKKNGLELNEFHTSRGIEGYKDNFVTGSFEPLYEFA